MPRFRRLVVPGFAHHVTQRGVRRQTTFFDEYDYRAYLNFAAALVEEWPVEVWAYCLMPNHIHAIVVPRQDDCLSRYFAILHQRYARRTNARHEWAGHLWQKRFYSVVMDDLHTITAMRYVEMNPVRAGLCEHPAEWPWSSCRGNLGLAEDSLVDHTATRDVVADWDTYLASHEDAEDLQRLRRQTDTGRPGGSDTFIDLIESRTNRRVRKQRAGRRRK